jgi:type II secretory pathway pseudopilin PulG
MRDTQVPSVVAFSARGRLMGGRKRRSGLTMLEVLIIIGILLCLGIMLLPAIQNAREKARRTQCVDNLKRLGRAMHDYHDAHVRFPPSSGVSRDADGKITTVDGWSWQVAVLPYLDKQNLYNSLDVAEGRPLVERGGAQSTPHADALAMSLPELLCPSFGGSPYADATRTKAAITNYKTMGATHIESLSVASPHPLTPKYNPQGTLRTPDHSSVPYHPDGGCFPGTGLKFNEYTDGLSNTILLVETVEPQFSRWTVGAEASIVGLPPTVEFERRKDQCFVPKGIDKAVHGRTVDGRPSDDNSLEDKWDMSTIEPIYWTYRTYIDWDYEKSPYDGADGMKGGKYGPSSHHPMIVNHLFADGGVRSFHRDIDVTVYMHLITKAGGDLYW